MSQFAQHSYERYAATLALLVAFLLPLKLSIAYIVLIPYICLWCWVKRKSFLSAITGGATLSTPLLFLLVGTLASSFFGIAPLRSIRHFASFFFYTLTIPVYRDATRRVGPERLLFTFAFGQTIAALHSILDGAYNGALPSLFIGKVSESGQLGLVMVMSFGLLLLGYGHRDKGQAREIQLVASFPIAAAIMLLAFAPAWHLSPPIIHLLSAALIALFLWGAIVVVKAVLEKKVNAQRLYASLALAILPMLAGALLVNLKRGPWAGVSFGLVLFLWIYARRWVMPTLLAIIALAVFVGPVENRLALSLDHFFISGGRSEIWRIGSELIAQYPLGIGYSNSPFLRRFSAEIPDELRHFHNNLLNITVELGWLSLLMYVWWIARLFRATFQIRGRSPLLVALGCALASWQVAGLVEYNFGDSEVVLIAFSFMGTAWALSQPTAKNEDPRAIIRDLVANL